MKTTHIDTLFQGGGHLLSLFPLPVNWDKQLSTILSIARFSCVCKRTGGCTPTSTTGLIGVSGRREYCFCEVTLIVMTES